MARKLGKIIMLVVALVIIVGLAAGGFLFATNGGLANTKSSFNQQDGRGINWRGHFQDYTEMLDSAQYITAWKNGEDWSEKVIADVQLQFGTTTWSIQNSPAADAACPAGSAVRYELSYADKKDVVCYGQTGSTISTGWHDLGAGLLTTALKGPVTGVLDVKLFVYEVNLINPYDVNGWAHVATDQANLVSGAGSCHIVSPVGRPARPSEPMTVACDLGYSRGSGWSLYIGSTVVATFGNGPGFDVKATFAAPSAAGVYEAHLVNSLYPIDFFPFSVTVNPDQAPPKPVMSVTPAPPWLSNGNVSLSWRADVNPTTKAAIKTVHVVIKYTTGEAIAGGGNFPGPVGSTTFNLGRDTDVEIYVVSEDANGAFSEPADGTYAVVSCDINNKCNGGPSGPGLVLPIFVIFLLVGLALILVAVLIRAIPIFPWKMLLILIGVIFILVAVIFYPA